jgi:hypothetical protein
MARAWAGTCTNNYGWSLAGAIAQPLLIIIAAAWAYKGWSSIKKITIAALWLIMVADNNNGTSLY